MKIEQLLSQYFRQNKSIALQGIGIFTLTANAITLPDNKEIATPENAILFQYDNKTPEDEGFIDFIAQQTHKIKPLASADLDSYLTLGKQFLHIGKPFKIEGLGILEKNQSGEYELKQALSFNPKQEQLSNTLKEKEDGSTISFAIKKRTNNRNTKKLFSFILIVALSFISVAIWYFLNRKIVPQQPITLSDSTAFSPATLKKLSSPTLHNGYTFKVVFKEGLSKDAAIKKMNIQIKRGHNVIMHTTDSIQYKLAEPFTLPLSDTTKVKDSLNRYYYLGKAYVELN